MKNILKDRREIYQVPFVKNGRVLGSIIPNYKMRSDFMTENERCFFKKLQNVVVEMSKRSSEKVYYHISAQVAINRLIEINDMRNKKKLYEQMRDKSVDFVIYDLIHNKIICAIELDTKEHFESIKVIERDDDLYHMFNGLIPLVRIPAKGHYDYTEEYITKFFKEYKIIDWEWES